MSSLLSAEDLNDFIAPGLACVKPVEALPPPPPGGGGGAGEIEVGVGTELAAPLAAQILLADCLACLGCVTLAEEVLVAQHSHGQLLRALDARAALSVFVASVLHQLRALLAAAFGRSVREVDAALLDLLQRQMGFRYVVGTGLGRKLSLVHEARLVIARTGRGPVLLLVCPGWVLYAEKTHPHVLGHLSTVKLPQQITGCLLKTLAGREVYHLSVMPCFDKKLESARPEADAATAAAAAAPDVDCVLTAKELVTLIGELEGKYALRWGGTPDYAAAAPPQWPVELSWASDDGSALGGYAFNYLEAQRRHVAAARGLDAADFAVETRGGRNADIVEMRLLCRGEPVASAAVVNGFRNIQNLVRKLKPGAAKVNPLAARRRARKSAEGSAAGGADADASRCDYVEIMACPSGCINGGGQVAAPAGVSDRDWVARTTEAYREVPVAALDGERLALEEWCAQFCRRFGLAEDRLVRTWFKEVQPPTDPAAIMLGTKW